MTAADQPTLDITARQKQWRDLQENLNKIAERALIAAEAAEKARPLAIKSVFLPNLADVPELAQAILRDYLNLVLRRTRNKAEHETARHLLMALVSSAQDDIAKFEAWLAENQPGP
jgi:hypothetical protein